MTSPTCYCGSPSVLRKSRYGQFWACSRGYDCDGLVGCHPGTKTPLGVLADKPTRDARKQAHDAFDGLWEPMGSESRTYRAAAYRWLAEELDIDEPHMGAMDRETALHVVEMCEGMDPDDLDDWLEAS